MKLFTLYLTFLVYTIEAGVFYDNKNERAKLLEDEALMVVGGKIKLSDKESIVNNCLMQHKFNEVDYGFDNPKYFNLSHHFFTYRDAIRKSSVYKIIKNMPKGAALHVHDMGILCPNYLMNLTYMDHLYVCFESNSKIKLKFAKKAPQEPCSNRWQLMSVARSSAKNVQQFDKELRKHFTLVVDNPDQAYPSITESWSSFMNYFITVSGMLTFRPIWEQYFYDALKKFREEKIMYVEVRSILPNLYELDGTEYDTLITAKAYKKVINKFVKEYPDFLGAKIIYAPSRLVDQSKLDEYLRKAKRIKENEPEVFAGFDLVGQEDLGGPLVEFAEQLKAASKDLNYFFHAGETDWYGTLTDNNLVDAILLGAKRIGHAYALPKHPLLMQEVVKRDIGIEVNVISNTVLSLVKDMRNHPLGVFLAHGLPVVISSDDPGVWGADLISDDFYVAFVGVASRLSDLRLLKQLAINSIRYSAIDVRLKGDAFNRFYESWNEFINNFDCKLY